MFWHFVIIFGALGIALFPYLLMNRFKVIVDVIVYAIVKLTLWKMSVKFTQTWASSGKNVCKQL